MHASLDHKLMKGSNFKSLRSVADISSGKVGGISNNVEINFMCLEESK